MKFTHDYRKLELKIFPTVRSVKYLKTHRLEIGDFDAIYVKKEIRGYAKIIDEEQKLIREMDLAFLRYDTACSLPKVENKQEYVDLLNSFIKPWTSNTLDTRKSIIWMMWKE